MNTTGGFDEDELLAALREVDAKFCEAEGRGRPPARRKGVRELFFLAGADWMKRQIEARRTSAAGTSPERQG